MMFAMLAAVAVMVTNQPPVSIAAMTPKERIEWRSRRSREMYAALHVDEARREAFRYEVRKRRLNRAAADILKVSEPSNAVVRVSVDYKSGDIRVEFADGYKIIQRYTPPEPVKPKVVARPKPKKKEGY